MLMYVLCQLCLVSLPLSISYNSSHSGFSGRYFVFLIVKPLVPSSYWSMFKIIFKYMLFTTHEHAEVPIIHFRNIMNLICSVDSK